MRYTILTVGSKPDPQAWSLIEAYQKRINSRHSFSWQYIPHGQGDKLTSLRQEAARILDKITPAEYVILLDERGSLLSSEQFSEKLSSLPNKQLVFIIGGAYGVDQTIRDRAQFVWSLSPLVFPHQLVRILLAEQLYRADSIAAGHPYHHA